MKILTIVILFVCALAPVHARLAETMAECEKRYGQHTGEEKDGIIVLRTYTMEKVNIVVAFSKGKGKRHYRAQAIIYTKSGYGGFGADMLRIFLGANKGNSTWKALDYTEMAMKSEGLERQSYIEKAVAQDAWFRVDKAVYAVSLKHKPQVMIFTEAYRKYLQKKVSNKSKF